jgi:lysophospholipase L1-like esterase
MDRHPPPGPRFWKRLLVASLLVLVSFSATAAVLEVALRLLGHHGVPQQMIQNARLVDDPVVDWRYEPGSEWSEGPFVYRYNSAGFRDVEHAIEKPEGMRRIVVVGDSVTEAIWVAWDSTFVGVLQSRLQGEYEVINLGQSGLNTPQEIHLFEQEGLRYEPDIVVLNFVLNDCDFYSKLAPARRYFENQDSKIGILFDMEIDPRFKRALKSSALLYFVKERAEELKGRIVGGDEGDYFEKLWASDENRAKVVLGFDQLAALEAQHGFEAVVIIWPLLTHYDAYRYRPIHAWVREAAQQRGFATVDLLPAYESVPYRDLQLKPEDNVHPNALGHGIAAEAFLYWLTSFSRNSVASRAARNDAPAR